MSKRIDLTKEEVFDVLDTGSLVDQGAWKWGHTETYVFDRDNAKYKIVVQYHTSEGLMMYGNTLSAVKVKPVERTFIDWVEE